MYNRREFLIHSMWLALLSSPIRALPGRGATPGAAAGFTSSERETLAAAMDVIIPAGDDMPSASAAGGVQYLEYLGLQYANIQEEISLFLQTLAQASAAEFGNDFPKLTLDQRFRLLEKLEKNQTAAFSSFVNYVYESYYTRPQVLGLVWCAPSAPPVENDEDLLAPVRKLTHLYKDVP